MDQVDIKCWKWSTNPKGFTHKENSRLSNKKPSRYRWNWGLGKTLAKNKQKTVQRTLNVDSLKFKAWLCHLSALVALGKQVKLSPGPCISHVQDETNNNVPPKLSLRFMIKSIEHLSQSCLHSSYSSSRFCSCRLAICS